MATFPHDWTRLASPAASSNSTQSSYQGYMDPFRGQYPNAPHLRPIDLPETGSPGYNPGSSRSRPMSLPAGEMMSGLGIYGIPSPPTSPQGIRSITSTSASSSPTVHPLLRGSSATLSAPLAYSILRAPTTHGTYALRTAEGARITSHDLLRPATHPPCPALVVSILLFPNRSINAPRRFLWDITLTPSRRVSAPPHTSSTPLALGDALASLHISLLHPISETDMRQFPAHEVQNAYALRAARRAAFPSTPAELVRADFLYGCTEFAGFVRNADNSFAIRLVSASAMA